MRFLSLIILVIFFSSNSSNGQELKRNTIYLEAGGATFFYSINYDRLLKKDNNRNLAARVGVMYLNLFNDNQRVFQGIAVGFLYIERMNKNFIEFGVSTSAISDSYYPDFHDSYGNSGISTDKVNDLILMESLRIGIRHQPSHSKIFWNALFQLSVLIVGEYDDFTWPFEVATMPLVSLGAGYSF